MGAVRPSETRPGSAVSLLRMTFFLNVTKDLRHPEEARSAVSKDARLQLQPASPRDSCRGRFSGYSAAGAGALPFLNGLAKWAKIASK